jgi:FKBP-type peptidyl-prolyl cis-trans isomerase
MNKPLLLTGAIVVLALSSCKHSEYEGYTSSENGLNYRFYNQNEYAPKAQVGEGISIRYMIKKHSNDSVIFDSKSGSPDGIKKLALSKSLCAGGIEDALMMMAKGDSASFIINSDSFFLKTNGLKQLPPFIKPGDHLDIFVKMVDIKTKQELEENQKQQQAQMQKEIERLQGEEAPAREKYLADNKITAKPTTSGLIFIESTKGKGNKPKPGDTVSVNYAGTTLDGKEFDNSFKRGQPIRFPVGRGMVIPGWEEGLQLMTKGSKAKFIIPSNLGYGPQGNQAIPPYATLVFEIELVDIIPGVSK